MDSIRKAKFQPGLRNYEYLSAALLDLAWHTLPADAPLEDVEIRSRCTEEYKVNLKEVRTAIALAILTYLEWRLFGKLLCLLLV
ncbi:hypothetical protein [Xylella fastidiosa]|uniref:hypothetical protein n=1 Tax=Xylella fastidiosa TaxID=2371 RepID=UPI003CE45FBA